MFKLVYCYKKIAPHGIIVGTKLNQDELDLLIGDAGMGYFDLMITNGNVWIDEAGKKFRQR